MKVIILGGLGDGIVVASIIQDLAIHTTIELLGFLNNGDANTILGYPVFGNINDWQKLNHKDVYFISALLKTKHSIQRSELILSLEIPQNKYCNIIHPSATISRYSSIGKGNLIGPSVNIMPNVTIGNHCSFRASASIGHDCKVQDFCYMGPNSTLSGGCALENGAHIGPNASVVDKVTIHKHTILGAGSVATKNISPFSVFFGIPAKKIGIIPVEVHK